MPDLRATLDRAMGTDDIEKWPESAREYYRARFNDLNGDPAFEQGRSYVRDRADDFILWLFDLIEVGA